MYSWRHIPVIRILVPFVLGIIIGSGFSIRVNALVWLFCSFVAIVVVLHYFLRRRINLKRQSLSSILLLTSFFISGVLLTEVFEQKNYSSQLVNLDNKYDYQVVRIIEDVVEKPNSIGVLTEVIQLHKDSAVEPARGKIQLYIYKDSFSQSLAYGDHLLIKNKIKFIQPPTNPYQFNFNKYYSNKNIYMQGYLDSVSWQRLDTSQKNWLIATSYKIRSYLKKEFVSYFPDRSVRGVAEALLFGYKEDLDEEWLDAFSKTGTIHVLAVSGLHVGIFYFLLSVILRLKKSKGWILLGKSLLIVMFLFGYCLLTGFAPSVSRASLMFSTVLFGKAFNRQSNIYNTLGLSALILLVINPFNLFNVGFQFSYLAVLGIVYYKDKIRSWLPVTSWVGDKIAVLLSVSIAAQLTTFPLGLYYFHQYPNLFFISNLMVIPCITVILYGSLLTTVLGLVSKSAAIFLAKVPSMIISFIAVVVRYIQDIPYAFFEGVHITFGQMILLYIGIIIVTISLKEKWNRGLYLTPCLVAAFIGLDIGYINSLKSTEVVIFHKRNATLIGFKSNNYLTLVTDNKTYLDETFLEYIIEPYQINERLTSEIKIIPLELLGNPHEFSEIRCLGKGLVVFNNESFLFLDEMTGYVQDTIEVDNLVVGSQKNLKYLEKVIPMIKSSNTIYLDNWRNERFLDSQGMKQALQNRASLISR